MNGVYSGKNKLIVQNRNFMTRMDAEICMADLNTKKCEGYDRIPVCAIWDACVTLIENMTELFSKIFFLGVYNMQYPCHC